MKFGFMPHAQKSTKATSCIATSSESSGNSTTHLTALLPFKDLMNQAPFTEIAGKMGKLWRGHRPGIGYGQSSGLRNYMIAALALCQIQVLAHPTQSTMKSTSTEHDILAGDRSEREFNDEVVLDLPTKNGFDLAFSCLTPHLPINSLHKKIVVTQLTCWDICVDLAQF